MDKSDKAILLRYLNQARTAMLWKLDGLSEYDIRRPMTPTGTNLLGIVKHLAQVELGYLGDAFGRPAPELLPWGEQKGPNVDMFALAQESSDMIMIAYRNVNAHADETVGSLALNAPGTVPWWPDDINPVSLQWIIVHMTTETNRHVGQADIIRELLDESIGHRPDVANLPPLDEAAWREHVSRVEHEARSAAGMPPPGAG